MKKKLLLSLSWIIMGHLSAQIIQLVSPASAVITTASGTSYSWSIGEIATLTVSNATNVITQGQQQPIKTPEPPPPTFGNGLTIGDGNGKNDRFVVDNIKDYPNNRLTIVNRWGEILYKKDEPYKNESGWDGTDATGSPVESGTYYYIFYPDVNVNKTKNYKGFILVIKP
jgi:gliding motility-associated-like protein